MTTHQKLKLFSGFYWMILAVLLFYGTQAAFFGNSQTGPAKFKELITSAMVTGFVLGNTLTALFRKNRVSAALGGFFLGIVSYPMTLTLTAMLKNLEGIGLEGLTVVNWFQFSFGTGFALTMITLIYTGWALIPLCAVLGMTLNMFLKYMKEYWDEEDAKKKAES